VGGPDPQVDKPGPHWVWLGLDSNRMGAGMELPIGWDGAALGGEIAGVIVHGMLATIKAPHFSVKGKGPKTPRVPRRVALDRAWHRPPPVSGDSGWEQAEEFPDQPA